MLCYQPASWRTSESCSETFGAIRSLQLNTEGAQDIDTPTRSGFPVLFILGHGRRDFAVYQPVAAVDIVVVPARPRTLGDEGTDMFDGGESAGRATLGGRRHDEEGLWGEFKQKR